MIKLFFSVINVFQFSFQKWNGIFEREGDVDGGHSHMTSTIMGFNYGLELNDN